MEKQRKPVTSSNHIYTTPFLNFVRDYQLLMSDCPLSGVEVTAKAYQIWKDMSHKEKKPYEESVKLMQGMLESETARGTQERDVERDAGAQGPSTSACQPNTQHYPGMINNPSWRYHPLNTVKTDSDSELPENLDLDLKHPRYRRIRGQKWYIKMLKSAGNQSGCKGNPLNQEDSNPGSSDWEWDFGEPGPEDEAHD